MPDDLATRIEAATEGTRELSDEVLLALGWHRELIGLKGPPYRWIKPGGQILHGQQPDPACSVDDALALLPANYVVKLGGYPGGADAMIFEQGAMWSRRTAGSTIALALSAALVRAAASEETA